MNLWGPWRAYVQPGPALYHVINMNTCTWDCGFIHTKLELSCQHFVSKVYFSRNVYIFCSSHLSNTFKSHTLKWNTLYAQSSLLRTFGLSTTSTYDSYLPLIFGIFGMIWGHFWNVRKGRFRGHAGRRGQTASKSKTTKILNQNLQKLDEIQNLVSATSKMTSWPQRPRLWLNEFFQKIHF